MDAANHLTPDEILTADPMLGVLREHHPDVDVVLLPGPAVPGTEDEAVLQATPDDLARLAEETELLLEALVARLAHHPSWPDDPQRDSRWRRQSVAAADRGFAQREAVLVAAGLAEGDNVALLRATGNALLGLGWQARPVPGGAPRLTARRGAFTAAAIVRAHSLQVTVGSGHVLAELGHLR